MGGAKKIDTMIKHLYFESKHLADLTRCLDRKYSNGSKTKFSFTFKSLIPEVYTELIIDLLPELDELIFGYNNRQCREYLWSLHHGASKSVAAITIYSSSIPDEIIAEINLIIRELLKIQTLLFQFELDHAALPSGKLIDCGFAVCNEINYIR